MLDPISLLILRAIRALHLSEIVNVIGARQCRWIAIKPVFTTGVISCLTIMRTVKSRIMPMIGKKEKRSRFELILKRLGQILSLGQKLKHFIDSFF